MLRTLNTLLLVASLGLGNAPPCRAQAASPEDVQEAQALSKEGLDLYGKGRYLEAAIRFQDAYRLVKDARLLYNLARAHEGAGSKSEALLAYRELVTLPDSTPEQRRVALERIDALSQAPPPPETSVEAEDWPDGARGEVALTLGISACVQQDQGCSVFNGVTWEPIKPNAAFSLWAGVRLMRWVGIYLDMDVQGLKLRDVDVLYRLHLLAVVRGFYTHRLFEAFAGLGLGYGHYEAATEDSGVRARTSMDSLALKVTLGAGYRVLEPLTLGLHLDFYTHHGGQVCIDADPELAGIPNDCYTDGDSLPAGTIDIRHSASVLVGLMAKLAF